MQLLDEAFWVLGAEDVISQFGVHDPWDVVGTRKVAKTLHRAALLNSTLAAQKGNPLG
jgi:hypothetical protein